MRAPGRDVSLSWSVAAFPTLAELIAGVYASLVDYLADRELLRFGPFDAAFAKAPG